MSVNGPAIHQQHPLLVYNQIQVVTSSPVSRDTCPPAQDHWCLPCGQQTGAAQRFSLARLCTPASILSASGSCVTFPSDADIQEAWWYLGSTQWYQGYSDGIIWRPGGSSAPAEHVRSAGCPLQTSNANTRGPGTASNLPCCSCQLPLPPCWTISDPLHSLQVSRACPLLSLWAGELTSDFTENVKPSEWNIFTWC